MRPLLQFVAGEGVSRGLFKCHGVLLVPMLLATHTNAWQLVNCCGIQPTPYPKLYSVAPQPSDCAPSSRPDQSPVPVPVVRCQRGHFNAPPPLAA